MSRAVVFALALVASSCGTLRAALPRELSSGAIRYELLQAQMFRQSGSPETACEVGRWRTDALRVGAEEASSRGDRELVRRRFEYAFGVRGRDLWKVKCDVTRPRGAGPVTPEVSSASVYFCTHASVAEGVPSFELRLSPFDTGDDAGLVRAGDTYITLDPGKAQDVVAGYVFRERGAVVAAVESVRPRGFVLSESVSGWRADVLAAASVAIAASGEWHYDVVRPWVDPGGSF